MASGVWHQVVDVSSQARPLCMYYWLAGSELPYVLCADDAYPARRPAVSAGARQGMLQLRLLLPDAFSRDQGAEWRQRRKTSW